MKNLAGAGVVALITLCVPAAFADAPTRAIATIKSASGSSVSGVVKFVQQGTKVEVSAELEGLSPGAHGFHIHETGDCSAPDASSAGGHFNPKHSEHGSPGSTEHHVGDLGNLNADDEGDARVDLNDSMLTLSGPESIIGKAVLVHEKADDFKTQPTGNSGGRIGCGVITALK